VESRFKKKRTEHKRGIMRGRESVGGRGGKERVVGGEYD
jgi:hypothetical protein